MAVLGRLLVSSAERLDLPDFLSIDSYIQGDFKYLLRSFVGEDKPYVLKGFDVISPEAAIGTQNISIRVADSVVYYPGSLAGPFFHGLEEGNLQAAPLVPELRKNSTNYVYLTLTTSEAAKDTRAFWDPDKNSGEGGEFTQDVNTQTVLSVDVNVSVSSFPENTIPVCKVIVGTNFIESIEDARDMMFRLATGGLNPNPLSRYSWKGDPTDVYKRAEPNTVMNSALDPNPFQGGDKNIESLKEWMDAVMTKLAELGGTTYWYEDTSVFNIISVFKDALATSIKSKGYWNSSDVSPGVLTWSEDIIIQSTSDLSEVIVRAGSNTLQNNEVLYLNRVREVLINTGSVAVEFFNAVDHINGQLGAFENLSKGDWVKKADDPDNYYRRVEEFYAAANKGGGVTAPAAALSVKLSSGYPGISEIKQASYIKGVYLSTEVDVASRDSQEIQDIAGNYYWLAMRSDTILNVSDITTTQLACDIKDHDGSRATVTCINHGLKDGQRITISGSANFDGSYAVSVEDLDTFYISVAGGPHADELAQSAFYATVTTAARTTDNGLQLESANHGLSTDQRVIISDTTNFNGDYQVFPLTNNTFTIAVSSLIASEAAGTSTSVNIYVRTDVGPTRLERGENKSIGEVDGDNLMAFIGMDNDAQTHPNYYIAPSYNTLQDKQNFNSDLTDNLTQRVSKLTAMMADKAQDKSIVQAATGITSYSNIGSGANRVLSFVPGGTFTAVQPGSPGNVTLALGGNLTLGENQVATYTIDRNAATNLANLSELTIYSIEDCPIEENLFVFAYRFTGTKIYLWNGLSVDNGITPTETPYIQKVNYIDLVTDTLPVTASVTIDGQSLVNGNTVLFAELLVDPGVYVVSGIGTAAQWTKVVCFQGGSDPLPGSNVNVVDGTSYFDSTWRFDGNRWKPLDGDVIAKARTGFPDESKANSEISFDDISREFTIQPTGTHFDIYQSGVPYRFEAPVSITIPDLEGSHFIYFNNGVLTSQQGFDFDIIEEWVYVANIYWDASNKKSVLLGDERHGLGMDAKTHEYLHNINGAQINNGFALGNFTTTGDGSLNTDAQISIANGTLRDEDITHDIVNSAAPSANFEQVLDPIAQIPIWYREGASGFWRKETATNAPVSEGVNTIHYNEFDGSVWQKTEAGDGNFVAMWIFVTNDIEEPIIAMMGQAVYPDLGTAQDEAQYNAISFGTLPAQEFKVAYRLIFGTNSSYANSYKAKLADVRDLRQAIDTAAPAYAGSYHGSLSGLTDQHHPDYAIFIDDPSQFSGAMTPSDDDVEKALQAIDPWFRQLRIKEHPVNKKRVTISAADALRTEGTTLSQVVKNLLLKFDGAEIDFATGNIYESDGVTSLGIDFTPETIPAGEWQWYSVTLIPSTVNADNTINGQLVVLAGSASGATKELAVKAPFANGTQLGMVAVQESLGTIADIPQSDIRQLGVGGGSGGGTGDANELLERVKNRLDLSEYDAVTPVIFSSVEEDLTDEFNTTASYDVANSLYNFELIGEQFASVQMVDDQFLAAEKDINDVELVVYWDLDKIDTAATYELSRDGGNEWQQVVLERIGNSDTYHGRHVFSEEATFTEVIENISNNTTSVFNDTIQTIRAQQFQVVNSMTIKKLRVGFNVLGSVLGNVTYKIIRDNGGVPSSDPMDVLFESVAQDISGLPIGNSDIEVDCTVPVNSGNYHLVVETDLEYRDNYLVGVNELSVRETTLGSAPYSSYFNGTIWITTSNVFDYSVTARPHDLRVRITSGTADVDLNGYAVFYDRDDSFSLISEGYEREVFIISGDDNINEFAISNFIPDPILMNVHEIETGQTHRKGAWTLSGTTVVFPENTFNKPGETITLEFLQMYKGSMQFDSRNRALLAENGLGSENPSLDLSQPGRGIRLRSPNGTLYEISIKDGGAGFDIWEIT